MDQMPEESMLSEVLNAYPLACQPTRSTQLGSAGGYSGATFWKLVTNCGEMCLRRWPHPHPDQQQLTWIHNVITHVGNSGFTLIPNPVRTNEGQTFCCFEQHLWELTPWLPGKANFWEQPGLQKLEAALSALAMFHQAAQLHLCQEFSPGVLQRCEQLQGLIGGEIDELDLCIRRHHGRWPRLAARGEQLVELVREVASTALVSLEACRAFRVPLQPCLRDVWHDHILFMGEDVSGMIDLGAMRIENVAVDIARLLGSLIADDQVAWKNGLEAYQEVRPLAEAEQIMVHAFDRSTVTLGGILWLQWVFVEGRKFENQRAIETRLDRIITRLQVLARN